MAYQARKNGPRGENTNSINNATNKNKTSANSNNSGKDTSMSSNKNNSLRDKVNSLKNGYNSLKNGYKSLKNGFNSIPSNPLHNPNMFRTTTGGIVGNNNSGGGKGNSLPSSVENKNNDVNKKTGNSSENENSSNNTNKSIRDRLRGAFSRTSRSSRSGSNQNVVDEVEAEVKKKVIVTVAIIASVVLSLLLAFFLLTSFINNILGNFGDLLGFNLISGGDIGEVNEEFINLDNIEFFNLVNEVVLEYSQDGKDVNASLVISTFHVIDANKVFFNYDDIDKDDVRVVCDAMFVDGVFDEEAFKENLVTTVFPRFGNFSESRRKIMVNEVYDYIEEYKDFIYTGSSSMLCDNNSNCVYDIKGFYIDNKGNVSENLKIDDLYVRLMQCGSANGHNYGGTFGQPLSGEELVPFEKYILGVAYQEISEDAPKEAIKAQMVAARSYILARHADMGEWRTLKKENGKWILQAASCTQDQVYCDPDKGCSSTDGQWGQVHSGLNHNNGFVKQPLSSSSPLRSYSKEVAGELLVNPQGYVIYAGYDSEDQNIFIRLANSGLDYKQILLQVYNQGRRNYNASNIQKTSCGNTSAGCGTVSTGEYVNWKQFEGPWANDIIAGSATIKDIGCFATSISILIAKSGVNTIAGNNFNPGTFVAHMRRLGGFNAYGYLQYAPIPLIAPGFKAEGPISLAGLSREAKLNIIKQKLSEGYYLSAEVMGQTGSHFVAIDTVNGNNIIMMDPGSYATDMWSQYPWYNTSKIEVFSVTR